MRQKTKTLMQSHQLLSVMMAGAPLSIKDAMEITGLGYAQAQLYLTCLEDCWDLETSWQDATGERGRAVKYWAWRTEVGNVSES